VKRPELPRGGFSKPQSNPRKPVKQNHRTQPPKKNNTPNQKQKKLPGGTGEQADPDVPQPYSPFPLIPFFTFLITLDVLL